MQNEIFSLKRFIRFSAWNLNMYWRTYGLLSLGMGVAFFAVAYLQLLNERRWTMNDWLPLMIGAFVVGGLLFAGSSFASFRTKEGQLNYLLVPASHIEKFVFEWLLRFVGFLVVYFIIAKVFGLLAVKAVHLTKASWGGNWDAYTEPALLNWRQMRIEMDVHDRLAIFPILSVIYFCFSLVFTGAVVFMKRPLVKTVLFVGAVVGAVATYFYIILEEFRVSKPFFVPYLKSLENDQLSKIAGAFMVIFVIWVLAYGFFKLKEKEV